VPLSPRVASVRQGASDPKFAATSRFSAARRRMYRNRFVRAYCHESSHQGQLCCIN